MADEQLVNTLENSAQILLAPPNLVTEEQRHVAEQVFITLEKSAVSIETCRQILEASKNDFVLFQAASLFRQGIVRNWSSLGLDVVDEAHAYILNYIINHESLVPYVREQLVLLLAVIYKRRQVEQTVGERGSTLFSDIARLVQSGNTYMQLVACSILLALLNEFSSSSRTSAIGLTWELHSKCKIKFEQGELKQVFIFCLQTLSDLLSHSSLDGQASVVVQRLLSVLEQIFAWDFTARISKPMVSFSNGQSSCFRPPMSWRDVILENDIVNVLFQLHLKVCQSTTLSNQSLLCLAQLASLTGPIFADEVANRDFVEGFIKAFLGLLSRIELKSSEALGIANVLGSLLGFTPSWALHEVSTEVLSGLLSCITQLTCRFCRSAHPTAADNQSEEDSTIYMEALEKCLDAGMTFVDHVNDFPPGILRPHAVEVFGTYLQCHLSSQATLSLEDTSVDCEDEDEETFSDQLFCIGSIARLVPDYSIPLLQQLLHEKTCLLEEHLKRIQPTTSSITNLSSSSHHLNLDAINEDLHWLLLIATNVLARPADGDCIPMIPEPLIDFTLSDVIASESSIVSLVTREDLPTFQAADGSHFVRLVAMVLRLGQLEVKAFQAGLVEQLSPQVSESLVGFVSRWAATYLLFNVSDYSKISPVFLLFGTDCDSTRWLIDFMLHKILSNLSAFNSEAKVVTKTLELLTTLVYRKNCCDVTVKCSAFWDMASSFSANAFPFNVLSPDARKSICKTLILASSANISVDQRQIYIQMVLGSFTSRFKELLGRPDLRTIFHSDSVKVEVQNSLDCLSAVAEAARSSNSIDLFKLLHPLLLDSVNILELYHNYEEVVQLVLELFNTVTKKLTCYLPKGDCVRMYEACLLMMQTFSKHNRGRRVGNRESEDDHFKDLLTLIEILMNIVMKDFIDFSDSEKDGSGVAGGPQVEVADVVQFGLNLLVPLMTTELLKIPALCSSYLDLLSYMSDVHAAQISRLSDQVFMTLTSGVEFAVVSHGTDITRLCLELIAMLASHVYEVKPALDGCAVFRFGRRFLDVLFRLLLVEAFDMELMEDASHALFALICCHQQRYCELVNEMLCRHSASPYYQRLVNAFNGLTPPDFPMHISRENRIKFMENFDRFLVDVRGFLCIQ